MIRFNNDYNHGGHPVVMDALVNNNNLSFGSYGIDTACEAAKNEIKKYLTLPDADIHFLVGGTQTNVTVISSILRPHQGVISAETGHINVHETGAVEHSGHKVLAVPHSNGLINASDVEKTAEAYYSNSIREHFVQPKVVYISYPTEFGTLYSKEELSEIYSVCKKYGMYLFIDGARLAYGLGAESCDITLDELAHLCDVFYIGGTKCGAMFGEAVVICNSDLTSDFRSYIKLNGAMLAKGWLLGLQFEALFRDGCYFDIGRKADLLAMKIKAACQKAGIDIYIDSPTNQQFVIITDEQAEKLSKKYTFEDEGRTDDNRNIVRFCTSWYTTEDEVDSLCADILSLN